MPDLSEYGKEAYIFKQETLSTDETKSIPVPDSQFRLKLHATTGYSMSSSSNMTTQPVADSSNRADHYTNNVENIRLSGIIADHVNPFRIDRTQRTARDYVEEIKKLKDEKQWITIVLPEIGLFKNCMITSFTPSRKSQTGLGTEVSLTFQKLLVATVGEVSRVAVSIEDIASARQESGTVTIGEPTNPIFGNLKNVENKEVNDYIKKMNTQQINVEATANIFKLDGTLGGTL